jgi:hypothetical protein
MNRKNLSAHFLAEMEIHIIEPKTLGQHSFAQNSHKIRTKFSVPASMSVYIHAFSCPVQQLSFTSQQTSYYIRFVQKQRRRLRLSFIFKAT